jgi:hypothetical protein
MKKLIKIIIAVLILESLFLNHQSKVYAQQVALSISPPIVELTAKPGKSVLVAYTLGNGGDPVVIRSKVLPFEARDTIGNIRIQEEFAGPVQFFLDNADVHLDEPYFLRSRASQQLLLRIRIPEGAPEGDYYYTFLHETQPQPAQEGIVAPRASATIGSNILITVSQSGKTDVNARIATFDTLATYTFSLLGKQFKFFDSNDPIPVLLQVENKGKNFIKPEGDIVLKGGFGATATYSILPQNIISESQRVLSATPSATLDCEDTLHRACSTPTTLVLKGFFIGSYKLSTTVNFGHGTPNLYASSAFVALPIKLFLAAFTVISISVFLIWRLRQREE